ncbi:DUF4180 domain-containing protein [Loktanella agnita]|uniref:DUF4180 domain-containing protein n=1 Tax=Loktanella agnita TaxID=287097 RepID=UPI0039869562
MIPAQGAPLLGEAGALAVIGEAYGQDADWIVIPKARIHPDMFDLSTKELGYAAQKWVNYGLKVAILGDFSAENERSTAFADFLRETNRGDRLVFVADLASLP